MLMCDCSPCPFSSLPPVLAELRQADLITSEECRRLNDTENDHTENVHIGLYHIIFAKRLGIGDVVRVQRVKSPEVMAKSADVLGKHGFVSESKLLAGTQSSPSSICLCYVVQWSLLMTDTL